MTDTKRLLDKALQGEAAARDALFARHLGRLLSFVRSRLTSRARRFVAPEDIVQETHLESARKLASFEYRGTASFYRWLVGIARFKISEADRAATAKKRQAEVTLHAPPAAALTSPSGRVMRRDQGERLGSALEGIGEDRAEAVRLRYLEGLSIKETAERLGRSEPAVKSLVSRGLADLASRLKN